MKKIFSKLFTARINFFLYSLLLVLTPFLMLQHYLQDAIGMFSDLSFNIIGISIPIVVVLGIALMLFLIIRFHGELNLRKLIVLAIIVLLWLLGQQCSDYYLNLPYYQLQHNWHYIAYGIFSILAYQLFVRKNISTSRIIIAIYLRALLISSFDEAAQIFLSRRVFDVSDIAKDLWGVLMGMLFIFFIYDTRHKIFEKGWRISRAKPADYFKHPVSLLAMLFIFAFIFLNVSSLLSDSAYVVQIVVASIIIFIPIFLLIHFSYSKRGRRVVFTIITSLLLIQGISFAVNYNKGITYQRNGLVVYRGIPIPYFDIMIFENGFFRLVDKKDVFNQTDIRFIFTKASDILLIGSGEQERPRMGFPEDLESQFLFNLETRRPLQVIILPTAMACDVYNRLIAENKKIVFIIHNSK
jgi:VanZ family protein